MTEEGKKKCESSIRIMTEEQRECSKITSSRSYSIHPRAAKRIINNNSLLQFTDETLVKVESKGESGEFFMTEEQRKCSKIISSSSIHPSRRAANSIYECIRVTISLAKVFNKDITEEEAKEIFNNACVNTNPWENNYDIFWRIVNYFDNGIMLNYDDIEGKENKDNE